MDDSPLPPSTPYKTWRERQYLPKEGRWGNHHLAGGDACKPDAFAELEGQQLTEAIRNADLSCFSGLFSVTGSIGKQLYSQHKMIAVANALNHLSQSYGGDNSQGVQQLILYLRAGYFVQFYQPDEVGEYSSSLSDAVKMALDTFFANPNTFTVSDDNGAVLTEAVILIDSAVLNVHYISLVKHLLTSFNQSFETHRSMTSAVNSGMIILFRGHQVPAFVEAVEKDTSLLDDLYDFYNTQQHLLDTDNEYLLVNVVRELGRFVQHQVLQPKVSGQLKAILNQQRHSEAGLPLWLGVGEIALYYDKKNCIDYRICDLKKEVEGRALPFHYTCSDSLKLRSQDMTIAQADWVCEQLSEEASYFHSKLKTTFQPAINDVNDHLEMVIFNSSKDYKLYAGLLFNISTDNGGMYLEGDPAKSGNQARFIAYEAEWLLPEFHVWNLRHEYAHYLDARFNLAGDFGRSTSADIIWWIEGLGEYIAHRDDYPEAVSLAHEEPLPLSDILRNTDNSSATLIYRWGYLAVRFMFEQHPSVVSEILTWARNDHYEAYQLWLDQNLNQFDTEWNSWLEMVESVENHLPNYGPGDTAHRVTDDRLPATDHHTDNPGLTNRLPKVGLNSGQNRHFYIFVPPGANSLSFTIDGRGGTGAVEILVRSDLWPTESEYEYSETVQGDRKILNIGSLKTGTYYNVFVKGESFSCIELMASYR